MNEEYGLPLGEKLPTFSAYDDEERTHTLQDLMGENGLILSFVYGTWCATCVQTLYSLARYAPQLKKEGFNLAAVLIDEPQDIHTFKISSPLPIQFPLLADKDQHIHQLYKADSSKIFMVVDRHLILRQKFIDFDGSQKPTLPMLMTAVKHIMGNN